MRAKRDTFTHMNFRTQNTYLQVDAFTSSAVTSENYASEASYIDIFEIFVPKIDLYHIFQHFSEYDFLPS